MNDVRMDPAAVRQHCQDLWDKKVNELEPEVVRIAAILVGEDDEQSRRPGDLSSTQTLGSSGEVWSGADFGATHDEHARAAVKFLKDLADGWGACANGAAAAAEAYTKTDSDSGLALALTTGEHTGLRFNEGTGLSR